MSYQQALQDIKLGYFEAAIAKLDPLLHKDPSQAKLWYAKALALVNLQRLGEAITTAKLAVGLNPSLAAAHHLLGNAYGKLGDKKRRSQLINRLPIVISINRIKRQHKLV
jgi:predicted Zn-dependent protease